MTDYKGVLLSELIPAMGCTEPIAIALCAARAAGLLGAPPERAEVSLSGNVIKNARSVAVPNTGGLSGIEAACAAGCFGGDAGLGLEVLSRLSPEQVQKARAFLASGAVRVRHQQGVDNLYIRVRVFAAFDWAEAVISGAHTRFVSCVKNGVSLMEACPGGAALPAMEEQAMDFAGILSYAEGVDFGAEPELAFLLDRQADYNEGIAAEGLKGDYGAMVGKTLMEVQPDSLDARIRAHAAAGSDARMAGCALPVVINSGSGNQGITASLPLIVYARETHQGQDRLRRALLLSNLLAIHMKRLIGKLSAFCGVVSAGAAAGAGLAWLQGLDRDRIARVVGTTLLTGGGILCDGAKASCASKIAAALDCALTALEMARRGRSLPEGQGLDGGNIDQTIRNLALVAREGMKETDNLILEVMLHGCPDASAGAAQ